MKQMVLAFLWAVIGLSGVVQAQVQLNNSPDTKTSVVPSMVRFAGITKNLDGKPLSTATGITFLLYKDEQGGSPLWLETQNVQPDSMGHYSVMLGATKADGLPVELFRSGEAQWLGVQIAGQHEQPRVLLLSVPYALKASDAETLGGLPASAFIATMNSAGSSGGLLNNALSGIGKKNYVPLWLSSSKLGNSTLFQGTGGNVGIGTATPAATLDVGGAADVRNTLTLFPKGTSPTLSISGTAFNVSNTGLVSFIPGQTFPGAGTVTSVALAAPSSDFTVSGSPITTSGTLTLGWTLAPTSANTANAIVKRDSLGNFSTNSVTANSVVSSGLTATTVTAGGVSVNGPIAGVAGSFSGGVSASTQTDANFVTGILGQQLGVSNQTIGVEGVSNSLLGIGVFGNAYSLSNVGTGLFQNARGIWGDSGLAGGVGVVATADDGFSLLAYNNSISDSTAFFENSESTNDAMVILETDGVSFNGQCVIDVSGNLTCTGSKSAAVPVDNGSRKVALYAVEAPENWFEDFGSGQLSNGATFVTLEPTFSQTVNTNTDYHVFLTPRGECEGLYVASTSAGGFEVRELHYGSSSVAFDYRIVARRKGYENIRLADRTAQFHKPPALSPKKGIASLRISDSAGQSMRNTVSPLSR